ncbi:MAG: hypothetical protein ACJ8AT_31235, partial [Hyalangium sp.]|uniref:hypothetical protein n=1 Tax=Hyalangium sp. TaxID=2028555 RepID=UPI00389A04A7
TTLYQWTQERDFPALPVGQLEVEQITKDLGTFKLRGLVFPIPADDEVRADVEEAAGKTGRNTPLKAVNAAVAMGYEVPEAHNAYTGFILYSDKDAEFTRFAGLVSTGDGDTAHPYIPESAGANARNLIADYKVKGEERNAEGVIRHVALANPGAVQDTEGFETRGSPILDQVRHALSA